MLSKDMNFEISSFHKKMDGLITTMNELKAAVRPDSELWDNADIIRNWKISTRTLSDWRAKGLIGYIQIGAKIWYPHEAREFFLRKYFINPKVEEKNDKEG